MTNQPKRTGRLPSWLKWTIIILPVVLVLVGLPLLVGFWDSLHAYTRRFPFPEERPFNEQVALEYSRKAFQTTRIDMTGASPVSFDTDRTNLFVLNALNTNRGTISWRIPSCGTKRRVHYSAYVEKIGSELVVTLAECWK